MDLHKIVDIATDGVASRIGQKHVIIVRFWQNVPQLMGLHCIIHQESLVMLNANKHFWIWISSNNKSIVCMVWSIINLKEDNAKIIESICDETHIILHIHNIQWFFWGRILDRLVYCMPTILKAWEFDEFICYHNVTSF